MKKILFLLALLLVPMSALSQTTSDQYKNIKLAWTPPTYATCNFTATPPVNTACVNGYQAKFTPPSGTGGTLATVQPCTATVTTNCIGPGSSYQWSPGGFLFSGTWGISLAAAYLDANGAQQFTAAVTTTVNVPLPFVPPGPVTGLGASPAP
jgi:hypothetical protein